MLKKIFNFGDLPLDICTHWGYNIYRSKGKGVMLMGERKKRRQLKRAARAGRTRDFLLDILSAIIAGLITAAIVKWLGW